MIPTANTPLCCNRKQGISKLRQRSAQQIDLILGQLTGKRIGNGSDGSCQFT